MVSCHELNNHVVVFCLRMYKYLSDLFICLTAPSLTPSLTTTFHPPMNRLFGSSATKKPKPSLQDAINSVSLHPLDSRI